MSIVDYYVGDGSAIPLEVSYIDEFPRVGRGVCAFCLGDPLAERGDYNSRIAAYYRRNLAAVTCPMCDGRPT